MPGSSPRAGSPVADGAGPDPRRALRLPCAPALCLLACLVGVLLTTAWLCDDCYFTLRTVDNFLNGHGLRWNLGERVQAYTHPLWMLFLSAAIGLTREHYFTTLAISISISLATCVLAAASAPTRMGQVLVLSLLITSRAFVDYSSSGLENPLSHLLAVLFCRRFLLQPATLRELAWTALLVALVALNRMDAILVFLPALCLRTWQVLRAAGPPAGRALLRLTAGTLGALALGFIPFLAWELFSFLYYGFPFPNTAYAKLGTGLAGGELARQGLSYLANSLRTDPVTLSTVAVASALVLHRRRPALVALAGGVLLYLLYTVRIGGDFMSGRFLSLPFLVATLVLAELCPATGKPVEWSPAALASVAGLVVHWRATYQPLERRHVDDHGITDERFFYFGRSGLLRPGKWLAGEAERPVQQGAGAAMVVHGGRGAFLLGGERVAINPYGLSDSLLARLPASFALDWRIGHFLRTIPPGYRETLDSGENRLEDPDLARFYDALRFVVSGPLFSRARLAVALDLNLGRYDHLVDQDRYRFPFLKHFPLTEAGADSWTWMSEGKLKKRRILHPEGLRLEAPGPLRIGRITFRTKRGGIGRVVLLDGPTAVWQADLETEQGPVKELEVGDVEATAVWLVPAHAQAPPRPILKEVTVSGQKVSG